MKPIVIIWVSMLAAMAGAMLGMSQERLLRRRRLEVAAYAEAGLQRLRWVGAGAAVTLVVKAALSDQPALAFAWVPLVLVGPWAAAGLQLGVRSSERVLSITMFATLNGVVIATGFTGRVELLLGAAIGFTSVACLALLARTLSKGAVTTAEVKVAALVGLACGSLGLTAIGVALACTVLFAIGAWAFGRFGPLRLGTALLAGAWVAGTLAL